MLCTNDKTYTLRSVNLSNTVLVVTPPEDADHSLELAGKEDTVVIRDRVNEILELSPAVPRVQKLITRIRTREYGEDQEDEETNDDDEVDYSWWSMGPDLRLHLSRHDSLTNKPEKRSKLAMPNSTRASDNGGSSQ